jgi:hypothetical protein
MLIFLLLWDPVLQALILGPLILFLLGYGVPEWLAVADGVAVALAATLAVRRHLRRDAAANAGPSGTDYIWNRSWDAGTYLPRLSLFLRVAGWRVNDSAARENGRATLVAEKFTCRLALLLIPPGAGVGPADIQALRALSSQARATHTALVSSKAGRADPAGPLAHTPIRHMRYKDLAVLDDVLGLGW